MNQKNIFSVLAVVLILQGIFFYVMGDKVVRGAFPNLDEAGYLAQKLLLEVPAALSILLGFIAYATRSTPGVLWAFTLGTAVLLCVTMKHMFVDDVKVPIPAVVIQVLIVLVCGLLWSQGKKV